MIDKIERGKGEEYEDCLVEQQVSLEHLKLGKGYMGLHDPVNVKLRVENLWEV